MDLDLMSRSSRWEKSINTEKEAAKRKREREVREKKRQEQLRRDEEEQARIRKLEKELAEERAEEERLLEYALTGGVNFKGEFIPQRIEESEDDKVILPQSALEVLNRQDALSNGPLIFRIHVEGVNKKITHCGVREFTATEGTIGLPSKVIDSLYLESQSLDSLKIIVKYVRLPKISYVKLQPKQHQFSNVGPVKLVLEENLQKHTTLSIDDIVTVWYRGKSYSMRVVEIRPEPYGTLLETDVEVDLEVSEEYQTHIQNISSKSDEDKASAGQYRTLAAASLPPAQTPAQYHSRDITESERDLTETKRDEKIMCTHHNMKVDSSVSTGRHLSLPAEPEPNHPDVITCRIRGPTGKPLTRRFLSNQPLSYLVDYLHTQHDVCHSNERKRIQLTTRQPMRVFTEDQLKDNQSFIDMGITTKQETFLLDFA
mmetsp:Transcript_10221/g.10294  ORF Transcript_10221/g.10294 Transcript_10221/m.10294 type:complete len:429 (-) Transcript_10221:330-1616(-)|eukprot:CAMPEP_0182416862 /NCGR_PEP_ID=MMETSP1167-20130531/1239_1 /TAXON_ID=2988 /ORGANISM="Mallomonas Sp, Strain CCMP3275" /LENGTH=428 /DNA_ID=CAMNT_0024589991 /DNA_START=213 /DNA_END=1499 /DNA_ORIENTATION=+